MRKFSFIIGYGALVINAIVAGLSLGAAEFLYAEHFDRSYFLAVGTILIAFGSLSPIFWGDFRVRDVFLVLIGQGAALILINAGIHCANGLVSEGARVAVEAWTAIYFSTVTWTTLGYGDFAPVPELQMLAAIEASAGLAFFGVLIGVTAHQVTNKLK